jgi:NADPH:quinone reductase-like Zn-dependent oxidoreductase
MKAIVINEFGGKETLNLTEVPTPQPAEDEVLVRIKAAGVNPVDWKIREGWLKDLLPHEFPIILGWDLAGVVEKTGDRVNRIAKGDHVFAYNRRPIVQQGTYAEYAAVPENYITKSPGSLSFEESASIPLAALTAYQAVYDAVELQAGQSILIIGASGGVGGFAVQFAHLIGAKVTAIASEQNHAYLQGLGAEHAICYTKADFQEPFQAICPSGADVVFDLIGGEALKKAGNCVKAGGKIVSITDDPSSHVPEEKNIQCHFVFVEPKVPQLDHIREMVDAGKLKTHLSAVYSLADVHKAHADMETGHTRGKIVLKVA